MVNSGATQAFQLLSSCFEIDFGVKEKETGYCGENLGDDAGAFCVFGFFDCFCEPNPMRAEYEGPTRLEKV
jgi:methyl coenzyme M reductase beta subunit